MTLVAAFMPCFLILCSPSPNTNTDEQQHALLFRLLFLVVLLLFVAD
jgi:hypothetical protein